MQEIQFYCSDCWLDDPTVTFSYAKPIETDNGQNENQPQEISSEDEEGGEQLLDKRKRRAFTMEEKIEILDYAANQKSLHAAEKRFKVDRKTVREWRKNEKSLRAMYITRALFIYFIFQLKDWISKT
jgi:hypothetical protein